MTHEDSSTPHSGLPLPGVPRETPSGLPLAPVRATGSLPAPQDATPSDAPLESATTPDAKELLERDSLFGAPLENLASAQSASSPAASYGLEEDSLFGGEPLQVERYPNNKNVHDLSHETPVMPHSASQETASWEHTRRDPSEPVLPINPDHAPRTEDEAGLSVLVERIEDDQTELVIDDLLQHMLDINGSDLHLSAKSHPMVRVHGEMTPLEQFPKLSGETISKAITGIMTTAQRNKFDENWELDFAYNLPGRSRFRVNVMKQRGQTSVVMRTIPWEIKTVEQLGLPEVVRQWATLPRGLVLITGPTGSGKSTTLAAIIDHANRTRAGHIVTVEDPIEFVHEHQKSVVNQREVGSDTKSFSAALKHALRQDPDIILVGEMRDLETISVALSAAETGHLVFGTLHTQSAGETISRIIDVFPDGAKDQVRTQLSATLQGVACQTLLKTLDGQGRAAAVEIMVATDAIRNLVREGKLEQIESALQSGAKHGMQTLDHVLLKLVKDGTVHWKDAAEKATDKIEFIASLGGPEGAERITQQALARAKSKGGLDF